MRKLGVKNMPLTSTQKNCNKILELLFNETEHLHSMDDEIIMQKLSMCQNDFDSAVEKLRRDDYIHGGGACVSLNDKGRDFAEQGCYREEVPIAPINIIGDGNIAAYNSQLDLRDFRPAKNPQYQPNKEAKKKNKNWLIRTWSFITENSLASGIIVGVLVMIIWSLIYRYFPH